MVMELPDTTSGVPLVLAQSVKIRPGGNLEVPLECTRQLTDKMDIRIDTGFHHRYPNIYVPSCCINNPNNKHNPRYMIIVHCIFSHLLQLQRHLRLLGCSGCFFIFFHEQVVHLTICHLQYLTSAQLIICT